MSLFDTIQGAREEAEAAREGSKTRMPGETRATERARGKTGAEGVEAEGEAGTGAGAGAGFTKKSASRAKPSRAAAASVRMESKASQKPAEELTKEERKARKERDRIEADQRSMASNIILENTPGYKKTQRMWWTLLGAGMASVLVSWLISIAFKAGENLTVATVISMVLLVASYVLIISAFVYDWRKARPMRKAADAKAMALTEKKMRQMIREDNAKKSSEKTESKGIFGGIFGKK